MHGSNQVCYFTCLGECVAFTSKENFTWAQNSCIFEIQEESNRTQRFARWARLVCVFSDALIPFPCSLLHHQFPTQGWPSFIIFEHGKVLVKIKEWRCGVSHKWQSSLSGSASHRSLWLSSLYLSNPWITVLFFDVLL